MYTMSVFAQSILWINKLGCLLKLDKSRLVSVVKCYLLTFRVLINMELIMDVMFFFPIVDDFSRAT